MPRHRHYVRALQGAASAAEKPPLRHATSGEKLARRRFVLRRKHSKAAAAAAAAVWVRHRDQRLSGGSSSKRGIREPDSSEVVYEVPNFVFIHST